MVEFLRGLGPQLEELYKITATTLVKFLALQEHCMRLQLEVFPSILPTLAESWQTDEKALRWLGMALRFLNLEVQRIHDEGRELTPGELQELGKHLRMIGFSLLVFQEIIKLPEESIMPSSLTGDLFAVRARKLNPVDREAAARRIFKGPLRKKPINYKLFSARRKELLTALKGEPLEERALGSIFLAADEIGDKTLAELRERPTLFKSRVSGKLADDLLGPKFWQGHKNELLEGEHKEFAEEKMLPPEAMLIAEVCHSLNTRELEILEAKASGVKMVELAAELGITPGNARAILRRARKKAKDLLYRASPK